MLHTVLYFVFIFINKVSKFLKVGKSVNKREVTVKQYFDFLYFKFHKIAFFFICYRNTCCNEIITLNLLKKLTIIFYTTMNKNS